jgi:hypothetical protein
VHSNVSSFWRLSGSVVVRHLVQRAHSLRIFVVIVWTVPTPKQKRRDSLLCKASKIFAHAHDALYNRLQICHEYVQLFFVVEVPLQIHLATNSELSTHFQISTTASILSCVTRMTTVAPPLNFTVLQSGIHMTRPIIWENIALHIVQYNMVHLWKYL